MYIYNNVLFSLARASAPELISFLAPTFNSLIVPSMTLIISIIGSLITLQCAIKDLGLQYNVFMNQSGINVRFNGYTDYKIMDPIFNEFGLNHDVCVEEFACEFGKITGDNWPFGKFIATKVWNDPTQLNNNTYLDKREKVFIQSLMGIKKCEKTKYNCELLVAFDKVVNKVKHQILTTTTTTTTPTPITPRSRFGINLDLKNYLEIINQILTN